MFLLIRWWLLLWVLGGSATSWAATSALQGQWLEDAAGTLSYEQVRAGDAGFQPYQGLLTRGYTASTYWLKLQIPARDEKVLVVRIRPPYVDHIELHDPLLKSGSEPPRLSGDRHPKTAGDYLSLNHGFLIPGSDTPRTIYLRVQSTSSMLLHTELLTPLEAARSDRRQELVYSAYLGLLVAFLAWAFLQWTSSRELLIVIFLAKQAIVLMHALAVQGYLPILFQETFRPPYNDTVTSGLAIAHVLSGAVFLLMLLREFQPVRWLWWLMASMLLAYGPIIGAFMLGHIRWAMQMNAAMAAIAALGTLLLALSARAWQSPQSIQPPLSRRLFVALFIAMFLGSQAAVLPHLGGMQAAEWTLHYLVFGGFSTSLIMVTLLSVRSRNLQKGYQQAELQMKLFEQRAMDERLRREEQEQFLAMLTHELKTPLAVARISLDASGLRDLHGTRIGRALNNINAIVDRCIVADQMEHSRLAPRAVECDLTHLMINCIEGCEEPDRVKVLERMAAPVYTDSGLMGICISNLIDNALKYSPAGSSVEVSVQSQDRGFVLAVRNAIAQAALPNPDQLFSKYYRGPNAFSKSGSGLGLYLSQRLAGQLGARLSHRCGESHVEFRLWLPA